MFSKQKPVNSNGRKEARTQWSSGSEFRYFRTDLSGSVAERLSHGDMTHSWRTGVLPIMECLSSLGSPGNGAHRSSTSYYWGDSRQSKEAAVTSNC